MYFYIELLQINYNDGTTCARASRTTAETSGTFHKYKT